MTPIHDSATPQLRKKTHRSKHLRLVPQCMARPRVARQTSKTTNVRCCINVLGLVCGACCSGPAWVSGSLNSCQRKENRYEKAVALLCDHMTMGDQHAAAVRDAEI